MTADRRRPLLTVKEVAEILRVDPMTVYRMCWSDELENIKVGRQRRITRRSLDKIFQQREQKP